MAHRDEPKKPRKPKALPPGRPAPDADGALHSIERLASILHEVRNLLDGSLRYVILARKNLAHAESHHDTPVEEAQRQLDIATQAMQMMSNLTHAAMQGPSLSLGSVLLSEATPVTLADAARHALDVLRPFADENRVTLAQHIAPSLSGRPCGALYTVILNGVRNAVESIARAGGNGTVHVTMLPASGPRGKKALRSPWIELEIADDGVGTAAPRSGNDANWGIGLAIARNVVEEMGGQLELRARPEAHDRHRPGAILRVLVPLALEPDEQIGAA